VARAKTLQEHISQGTFRRDRHSHLLADGKRPRGMPLVEWQALRLMVLGPEGEEEFHGLTQAEFAAHERLISGLPPHALARARARPAFGKRVDLTLGEVHPMLRPAEGRDFDTVEAADDL
jgi:hypothetical protein